MSNSYRCTTAPRVEALQTPETYRRNNSVVDFSDMVSAGASRPMLLVGSAADPGAPAQLTVWRRSRDGRTWDATHPPVPVPGQLRYTTVTHDAKTVVIAGAQWENNRRRIWMLSSTNGAQWSPVKFPQEWQGFELMDCRLINGAPSMLVKDDDQHAYLIRLGDRPTLNPIPDQPAGHERGNFSYAASGNTVVVLARVGASDAKQPWVQYVSHDGGSKWDNATPAFGADVNVSGIAATPTGFVATGSAESKGVSRAASLHRPLGSNTWKWQPIQAPTDGFAETALGAPSNNSYPMTVTLTNEKYYDGTVYRQDKAGAWKIIGDIDIDAGDLSVVTAPTGNSAAVATQRLGKGIIGVINTAGRWQTTHTLGAETEPIGLGQPQHAGHDWQLRTTKRKYVVYESSTRSYLETSMSPVTTAGLGDPAQWQPRQARSASPTASWNDPSSGDTVTFAVKKPQESDTKHTLMAWVRRKNGNVLSASLPKMASLYVFSVTRVAGVWLALGREDSGFSGNDTQRGVVLTSDNGRTWQRVAALDRSKDETQVEQACSLPNGKPLVVGSISKNSQWFPAAWVLGRRGAWQLATPTPQVKGAFYGCAATDAGTIIWGETEDSAHLWSTTDGKTYTTITKGKKDQMEITDVTPISGGFAVTTVSNTSRYYGGRVWVTTTGKSWVPIPVPVDYVAGKAAAVNKDLITIWDTAEGLATYRIPNVANLLSNPSYKTTPELK